MATGRPPRNPRDAYTLTVQPQSGPAFRVTLNMADVSEAGLGKRDPLEAEVQEIIRQITLAARAQNVDLRRVDLQRNKARLKAVRPHMGRFARTDGLIYVVAGSIPDPVAAKTNELAAARAALDQRVADERAAAAARAAAELDAQQAYYDGQLRALQAQVDAAEAQITQRNRMIARMAQAAPRVAPENVAERVAREEAVQQANVEVGELEAQVERLNQQLRDAAQKSAELQNLKRENQRLRKLGNAPQTSQDSQTQQAAQEPEAPRTAQTPQTTTGVDPNKGL
jgi:DNA repair exonuclease SbcCD ATPase subunit